MTPVEKVLKTWYPTDHPLHNDPLPAVLGLAGEAGELIDLYKKERFKDGFSWWDCDTCGHSHKSHNYRDGDFHHCSIPVESSQTGILYDCHCSNHTPKILDELGDIWYYLRILAYQQKIDLSKWLYPDKRFVPDDMLMILACLNFYSARLLTIYEDGERVNIEVLGTVFNWFQDVLYLFDFSLNQLTESNAEKLKDGHGWSKMPNPAKADRVTAC